MIIDFHAHILPSVDHGCDHTETALKQLQLMRRAGTNAVVATSHFYPNYDHVASFLERREGAMSAMRRKLPLEDLPLIYPAAEVLVCPGIHKMAELEKLCVWGTNVILLEMPFTAWNDDLIATVLAVRDRGLCPVLAHIDRYLKSEMDVLLAEGILAQLNAEAFGLFGSSKQYLPVVETGQVVALGSDLHGAKARDYRRFVRAQKKLGKRAAPLFARTAALLKDAVPLGAPISAQTEKHTL